LEEQSFEEASPRVLGAERGFQGLKELKRNRAEGSQTLDVALLGSRATLSRHRS